MHVSKELKARVNEKLEETIARAERHFGQTFRFPRVMYTQRGTTAGTARLQEWAVNFNAILLNENVDDFIARTVPHEMAHLIDFQLYPENHRVGWGQKRSVHGPTWKHIMRVVGADPSRCHSYDVSKARVNRKARFVWTCKCGSTMELGPQRHKKMLSGATRYWQRGHAYCGGYTYGDAKIARPTVPKAASTAKRQNPLAVGGKGSIKANAIAIYRNVDGNRAEFIRALTNAGVSKNTASTYHHNIKSGRWG